MLSHDEQAAILERAIKQLALQRWKPNGRPTPYEVCMRRKNFLTREFMAVWVEEDGQVFTKYVGSGGSSTLGRFLWALRLARSRCAWSSSSRWPSGRPE